MMEIICVPVIIALVYGLIEVYKNTIAKTNEILVRIIPMLGLVLGAVAGIACFYACPQLIMANNIFGAILVGASSGLSATGCNQIFKQLKKYGVDVQLPKENESDLNEQDHSQDNDLTPPTPDDDKKNL